MNLEDMLARAITDKTEAVPAPAVDPAAVRQQARRKALRRRGAGSLTVIGLVAAVALGVTVVGDSTRTAEPASVGRLDFSDGVRAFVDTAGGTVHLGGRTVPLEKIEGLDKTGLATPFGVLYFTSEQEVRLLAESGEQVTLADPVGTPPSGFTPSSAYDAAEGVGVWLTSGDAAGRRITVYDLVTDKVVASRALDDSAGAETILWTLRGADHGVAFVSSAGGSILWDWKFGREQDGFTALRPWEVLDARNRVVLLRDLAPGGDWRLGRREHESWRLVPSSVGRRLTFDGSHVLVKGTTLMPVGDAQPLSVDLPGSPDSVPAFTLDSDGSVLTATWRSDVSVYYDCELPTGACEEIGRLTDAHAAPRFIGR